MYHFPNHDIYHPNPYQQQCPIFAEHSKNVTLHGGMHNNQFEAVISHDLASTQPENLGATSELQTLAPAIEKKQKVVTNKSSVDTSNYSIEERLVAAVWVHERKHTKNSMSQIKQDFRKRFGREPPAKNTLLVWERKLFSSGSVHDAPRPGRPVNRCNRVEEVAASVVAAPALSLRARARALRLPRSTLRTILREDLARGARPAGKPQIKRNVKRQLRRKLESQVKLTGGGACAAAAQPALPRNGYT